MLAFSCSKIDRYRKSHQDWFMKDFLDFIGNLFHVLAWPTVFVVFVMRFDAEIRNLLKRGFRFKVGDKEFSSLKGNEAEKVILRQKEGKEESRARETGSIEALKRDNENLLKYYFFEKIYRIIFGSQLKILHRGYLEPNGTVEKKFVQDIYFRTIWKNEESFYPIEEYIRFLTKNDLMRYDPSIGVYKISEKCREFIEYLRGQQASLEKQPDDFIIS